MTITVLAWVRLTPGDPYLLVAATLDRNDYGFLAPVTIQDVRWILRGLRERGDVAGGFVIDARRQSREIAGIRSSIASTMSLHKSRTREKMVRAKSDAT